MFAFIEIVVSVIDAFNAFEFMVQATLRDMSGYAFAGEQASKSAAEVMNGEVLYF
jgi:hypothetical protein